MLLEGKIAVIYGGAGAVGSTAARTFAREGAHVTLVGRTAATLDRVAGEVRAAGGQAETAVVDALDPAAVDAHLDALVARTGRVDVVLNATHPGAVMGVPLREMTVDDFARSGTTSIRLNFAIGTAAARRMTATGAGVILTLSTSTTVLSGRDRRYHASGGFGVACAAAEEFTRALAGEVGPHGVRVVCLRPDALPETWGNVDSEPVSAAYQYMLDGTALGRMPTLQQVADAAAFAASDRGGALTGAILNLTCGSSMSAT